MKRRWLSFTLAPCLLSATLFSASIQAEDLLDTYRLARENDPTWRAAAAAHQAALEVLPQSRALLLPSIALAGSASRNRYDDLTDGGDLSYSTNQTYTLRLRQPLFNRDSWVTLRQADSRVAQAEAEFTAVSQALILRVAEAYFAVLGAGDDLAFASAEKDAISRQLDQARQRFEVGLIAITDVHEAQARYDLALSREISAADALASNREALREITREPPGSLNGLTSELPLLSPDPDRPADWVAMALAENPAMIASRAALDTALKEIRRVRAGHLPTLDLTASQSYNDSSFGGLFDQERHDGSIGVELNLPVYSGGLVNSQTREARYLFQQAQENLEQQQRATERLTRDAYRGVITGISLVKALNQALTSTETALAAATAGFEVGTRTIVDVLDAQRERYAAQRDYARARYDYLLNTLRMKQAAGMLAETDLEQINQWLAVSSAP